MLIKLMQGQCHSHVPFYVLSGMETDVPRKNQEQCFSSMEGGSNGSVYILECFRKPSQLDFCNFNRFPALHTRIRGFYGELIFQQAFDGWKLRNADDGGDAARTPKPSIAWSDAQNIGNDDEQHAQLLRRSSKDLFVLENELRESLNGEEAPGGRAR